MKRRAKIRLAATCLIAGVALSGCGPIVESNDAKPATASAVPASGGFLGKEALIARAGAAMDICAEFMPDVAATKTALIDAGFRSEGSREGYNLFSLNGRRLLAGTSFPTARRASCIVVVDKMTPQEADNLAQKWVNLTDAQPIAVPNRDFATTYRGSFKGSPIIIAVSKPQDFVILNGAAILAIEE